MNEGLLGGYTSLSAAMTHITPLPRPVRCLVPAVGELGWKSVHHAWAHLLPALLWPVAALAADQTVPDVSVFRKEFISALGGAADRGGDGYVTGSELGYYLEEQVSNYAHNAQTPQYGKIRGRHMDKGDFVFDAREAQGVMFVRPTDRGLKLAGFCCAEVVQR